MITRIHHTSNHSISAFEINKRFSSICKIKYQNREISSLNKNFILEILKIDKKRKREGGKNKGKESSNLRS